jgi:hypothetical protein
MRSARAQKEVSRNKNSALKGFVHEQTPQTESGDKRMANPQRNTTVLTRVVGDGLAVLDPQRKQSHVLNATSALVFQHCDGQTTP